MLKTLEYILFCEKAAISYILHMPSAHTKQTTDVKKFQ